MATPTGPTFVRVPFLPCPFAYQDSLHGEEKKEAGGDGVGTGNHDNRQAGSGGGVVSTGT